MKFMSHKWKMSIDEGSYKLRQMDRNKFKKDLEDEAVYQLKAAFNRLQNNYNDESLIFSILSDLFDLLDSKIAKYYNSISQYELLLVINLIQIDQNEEVNEMAINIITDLAMNNYICQTIMTEEFFEKIVSLLSNPKKLSTLIALKNLITNVFASVDLVYQDALIAIILPYLEKSFPDQTGELQNQSIRFIYNVIKFYKKLPDITDRIIELLDNYPQNNEEAIYYYIYCLYFLIKRNREVAGSIILRSSLIQLLHEELKNYINNSKIVLGILELFQHLLRVTKKKINPEIILSKFNFQIISGLIWHGSIRISSQAIEVLSELVADNQVFSQIYQEYFYQLNLPTIIIERIENGANEIQNQSIYFISNLIISSFLEFQRFVAMPVFSLIFELLPSIDTYSINAFLSLVDNIIKAYQTNGKIDLIRNTLLDCDAFNFLEELYLKQDADICNETIESIYSALGDKDSIS